MSSSTRTPSFSLSLRALLTFPVRICNPPPAAGSVRSCKVTPLIKVSLDDVLNKRHLPPLTLKDFEEWLVFVEGKPQYLYFLLWFKEYESRYATWLAEFGFSYCPTTSLLSSESSCLKSTAASTNVNPSTNGLAVPTSANINYIPPSPSLALFFTRAKKTFFDPLASPASPYTLSYSALSTLLPSTAPAHSFSSSIPQFHSASRPDLVDINEKWKQASKALFGPESHPHPHPKELAALANHVRNVLKDSLERFAVSACHNVGTRRAWCGLAGGTIITLILGVLPTLVALFYARSRWVRLVGFWGSWLGGTVILSSLHGICMMIYVFGDLRQLRSFELARPAISNPRAIARARPRLRSLFTKTGKEENVEPLMEKKNAPGEINNNAKGPRYCLDKDGGLLEMDNPVTGDNQIQQHIRPNPSPSSAFTLPLTDMPGVKLGLPIPKNNAKAENHSYPGGDGHPDSKTNHVSHVPPWQRDQDQGVRVDHRFLSPQPLQLSTIISSSEDDSSHAEPLTSVSSTSPLSSVVDLEKGKEVSEIPVPIRGTPSLRSNASDLNLDMESGSSSSDHGIVISPAYQQTSMRYDKDPWVLDSLRVRSGAGKESQAKTWAASRNTSRSRVSAAVGSVVQWAISGLSTKRVNSNMRSSSETISITPSTPQSPGTTSLRPSTRNAHAIPTFSLTSTVPTVATVNTFNSNTDSILSRPASNAGTFGVRSWIGGMMQVVEKPSHSRGNSGSRSMSTTRHSKYQSRFGASLIGSDSWTDGARRVSRASRWSHGFGFGARSAPEESIFEESGSLDNTSPSMSVAAHAHTCACSEEYLLENEVPTQWPCHDQPESQAQTIASFYVPPRTSVFSPHRMSQDLSTASIDQYTAAFITREYAAEVLPDLEFVPRASLSMRRTFNEKDVVKDDYGAEKGEYMVNNSVFTSMAPADSPDIISWVPPVGSPTFRFEGLPGLESNEEIGTNVSDHLVVPLQIPPPTSSRPIRSRPPRLQLRTSMFSPALVIASSTPGVAPSITPISLALSSSQFSYSVPPNSTTAVCLATHAGPTAVFPSHSSPMTLSLPKSKHSKFWFDACPRHPEVEAKIAEAETVTQAQTAKQTQIRGHHAVDTTLAPPLPRSPASFSSTSRPSTFHSSPRALPNTLPDTHAYPFARASGIKSLMTKIKHKIAYGRSDTSLPPQVNTSSTHVFSAQLSSNLALSRSDTFSSGWRGRLKSVTSVPAFGPLTRVLSPVVSRGQWEIVVRSALYAFMMAWLWTGVMISLPPIRPHSFLGATDHVLGL